MAETCSDTVDRANDRGAPAVEAVRAALVDDLDAGSAEVMRTCSADLPPGLSGPARSRPRADTALADELGPLPAQLPDAQRAAVVMRHVADLPLGEVTSILGCPSGTAKSHTSRGVHPLRELIDEPDPDRPALASAGSPR